MMQAACFILRRDDTQEYYRGNHQINIDKRWSSDLRKAKKYKRKCDASNAATTMRDYKKFQCKFSVEVYGLTKIDEYNI